MQGCFYRWAHDGTLVRINHALFVASRERKGCEASPTAGVMDSQSVKNTESGGPRGYDTGKKIKGRKRPIITDTEGHLVGLQVRTSVSDRNSPEPDVDAKQLYAVTRSRSARSSTCV